MTNLTNLSARIAALEAQAAPLDDLNAELAQLVKRCNAVSCLIQDAVRAQHLLAELEGHAAGLFNSESMPINPEQSVTSEPQAPEPETPASTAEVLMGAAVEPINVESNSESMPTASEVAQRVDDAEVWPLTQKARFLAWVRALSPGANLSAVSAAQALGYPSSSCSVYARVAMGQGLLALVDGTGGSRGGPSLYRRAGPAPAHKPAPKPLADHLPRDLPPMVSSGVTATEGQMQAVQIALSQHGRPMSKSLLLNRVGMKACAVDAALRQLVDAGTVVTDGGRYALAGAA